MRAGSIVEEPLKTAYFLLPQMRLFPPAVLKRMCIYCLPVQIWRSWWHNFLNCLVLWAIILRKSSVIYVITACRKKDLSWKKTWLVLRVPSAFFGWTPASCVYPRQCWTWLLGHWFLVLLSTTHSKDRQRPALCEGEIQAVYTAPS